MLRTRMWPILLFSLLFFSCTKMQPSMVALAESGQYEKLLEVSRNQFPKDYQPSSLYYLALAQARTNRMEQAYHSLLLYDQMVVPSQRSDASLLLMIQVAINMQDYEIVSEKAQALGKKNLLDTQSARWYHDALLKLGKQQQADTVLMTYLRHTLDLQEYQRRLFRTDTSIDVLRQVLDGIEDLDEIIALLQIASRQDNTQERAQVLFSLANTYETQAMHPSQMKTLYEILMNLAEQANLRVQANKYRTLAQRN